jgi:hypothetical protein
LKNQQKLLFKRKINLKVAKSQVFKEELKTPKSKMADLFKMAEIFTKQPYHLLFLCFCASFDQKNLADFFLNFRILEILSRAEKVCYKIRHC